MELLYDSQVPGGQDALQESCHLWVYHLFLVRHQHRSDLHGQFPFNYHGQELQYHVGHSGWCAVLSCYQSEEQVTA